MAETLLPLFPLELVLLPGTPLPLHIFEERYKQMIGESIENRTEFGIVQAGEKGILNIGCTATVEKTLEKYPDGRMDIIVRGHRRFEIVLLDQQMSYLRAAVQFFEDEKEPPAPKELRALAVAALHALRGEEDPQEYILPEAEDAQLSFRIAFFVQDLGLRQTLLAIRSESERLRQLNAFLPEYIAKVRRTAHVKRVAPRNGHGMIKPGEVGE